MKNQKYNRMLNECMTPEQLDYLTVVCSTRSKATANKAKKLIQAGKFAEALKLADPIAYNVGFRES